VLSLLSSFSYQFYGEKEDSSGAWMWPVVPAFQLFTTKPAVRRFACAASCKAGLPHAELRPPTDSWCGPCGKCGPTIVSDNLPSYHANVTHVISMEQHDNNSGQIIIVGANTKITNKGKTK